MFNVDLYFGLVARIIILMTKKKILEIKSLESVLSIDKSRCSINDVIFNLIRALEHGSSCEFLCLLSEKLLYVSQKVFN